MSKDITLKIAKEKYIKVPDIRTGSGFMKILQYFNIFIVFGFISTYLFSYIFGFTLYEESDVLVYGYIFVIFSIYVLINKILGAGFKVFPSVPLDIILLTITPLLIALEILPRGLFDQEINIFGNEGSWSLAAMNIVIGISVAYMIAINLSKALAEKLFKVLLVSFVLSTHLFLFLDKVFSYDFQGFDISYLTFVLLLALFVGAYFFKSTKFLRRIIYALLPITVYFFISELQLHYENLSNTFYRDNISPGIIFISIIVSAIGFIIFFSFLKSINFKVKEYLSELNAKIDEKVTGKIVKDMSKLTISFGKEIVMIISFITSLVLSFWMISNGFLFDFFRNLYRTYRFSFDQFELRTVLVGEELSVGQNYFISLFYSYGISLIIIMIIFLILLFRKSIKSFIKSRSENILLIMTILSFIISYGFIFRLSLIFHFTFWILVGILLAIIRRDDFKVDSISMISFSKLKSDQTRLVFNLTRVMTAFLAFLALMLVLGSFFEMIGDGLLYVDP